MKTIANRHVLRAEPYVPGKPIDEVKRELGLKQVIKLASNESPFAPSPKVLKAIAAEAKNLNRYPDGQCFLLRQELAKRLKVAPEQIIFGNGSDEVIVMAIRAFIEPGNEVVIAKPSFLIYEIAAKLAGAKVKAVPLRNAFYDLDSMKRVVTEKTKMIFIGNPDNPAGTYVTQSEILDFLSNLRRDIVIFFDEAYFEYVLDKDYPDTLKLLSDYKNIIVARTFSKLYGLAGLRIGYGIADKEVVEILNRVREPFNVNSLAQAAALACLKDQAYYQRIAKFSLKEKKNIYAALGKMDVLYRESATNFILVEVKKNSSEVAREMLKRGVIVRDMAPWGMRYFIRMTIGTGKENKRFLQVLKEVL
ncbi:MAG: histidinol-phosphate transaminase [Omnitrophica WOR_2 bacterium RIFCSPHIGHO2_01_FULL_48_9]|nr:MAG: histidinol-phosphate transaminase [Omnitrophica WOR_2 bacterium RIFCSPHIGHO2_02_FULL_48_11]OGX32057.1 MAG: histidinol-phosphate transaminase [Omnitrophica WOR_2 bacterium RIFCSPHIGHO2_01_FULL_48_9]